MERIRERAIPMEQGISADYLADLSDSYTQFFHQYDESPVLIVNTMALNPIDDEGDFDILVQQIANFRGRRAYFNRQS